MGLTKKRQSKRLTTRKREGILKRARAGDRKSRRLSRKKQAKTEKVPASVLRTDEENMQYAEIKRLAKVRKAEHDEEMMRSREKAPYHDEVARMVSSSDVVVEVLDARDPESSWNVEVEKTVSDHGKRLVAVLNYTQHVPRDVVDEWKMHLRGNGKECVEVTEDMGWIGSGTRVGIFGNPKSGKNFVLKRIGKAVGEDRVVSVVSVPPSRTTLSSLLRGCHELTGIRFKDYVDMIVGRIDRGEVCLLHRIPEFETSEELLEGLCSEYRLGDEDKRVRHMKACERLLSDFLEHRILFWRRPGDRECDLSFCFPS